MKEDLLSLITHHRKLHPSAHAKDIYKMLHQGAMGPHHLVKQVDAARTYLWQEYERIDIGERTEPLTERVSIDGSVVRINLRPFKQRHGDLKVLFECLLISAQSIVPDEASLRTLWEGFKALNQQKALGFEIHEIATLDELIAKQGFVAISHSPEYRKHELPSYRVLLDRITDSHTLFK
jgi:hypothetical protein